MVTISNDRVTVQIAEYGAEMRRIVFDGVDYLWSGDADVWSGTAPIMFPICGALVEDRYFFEGKEYSLPKHGFARHSMFTLENQGDNYAVFLLTSSDETLKMYPFNFEFRVCYKLIGNKVEVGFNVKNTDSKTMYFSVGSHEAYACPEGIEDYDVIFPQNETLNSYVLDGELISHEQLPIIKESDRIALYNKFFAVDALVFKDLKSKSATLRNRKTGRKVTVEFPGRNYFLLWTMTPNNGGNFKYICMEPWHGVQPMVESTLELTDKEGLETVNPGCEFESKHIIHLG